VTPLEAAEKAIAAILRKGGTIDPESLFRAGARAAVAAMDDAQLGGIMECSGSWRSTSRRGGLRNALLHALVGSPSVSSSGGDAGK
jgi:hypothetical protein